MSFSELYDKGDAPLTLSIRSGAFTQPKDVELLAGDRIKFSTRFHDATGLVLSIDHGASFPVKVEFYQGADKRIVNFAPSEFIYLTKEVK